MLAGRGRKSALFSDEDSGHYVNFGLEVRFSDNFMCWGPQAYDQHLNMILGEVEEVVTTVDIDDETYEEIIRVRPNTMCTFTKQELVASTCELCRSLTRLSDVVVKGCCLLAAWPQSGGCVLIPCILQVQNLVFQPMHHGAPFRIPGPVSRPHQMYPDGHLVALQTNNRVIPYLFVRGDGVILVSPPLRH